MEEVMHIRNVLTKAELESLLVRPDLHEQVAKGKVSATARRCCAALNFDLQILFVKNVQEHLLVLL